MDILVKKENIVLGESLSPDKKKKKEPKHTLIEFGLYRGLIMVSVLSVLDNFGPLSKKQMRNMVRKKLNEAVSYGKIENMTRLLRLWGYVGKERVTKRLYITEKGKAILEKSKSFVLRLVIALFDKEFVEK